MYQGKFRKNANGGAAVQEPRHPVAPTNDRAPSPEQSEGKKKRSGKVGTIIFYSLLLAFVLAFCIAMGYAMNALNDWLVRFEASQPTAKCQTVFSQLFENPDWENLYALSDTADDVTAEVYADHMTDKVGDTKLTYIETSAGLSGDKKYIVRCGSEKVATFTLHNAAPEADIPDWQLGTVALFYSIPRFSVTIQAAPDHTVIVDGKELDDSHVIRTVTTKAEDYLPEGVHGYRMNELLVEGLLTQPQVEIRNPEGQPLTVQYDSEYRIYYYETAPQSLKDEHRQNLVYAAQTYCRYMIGDATRAALRNCFDSQSEIYQTITANTTWMQSYASYQLGEAEISDYYCYSDEYFSARIALTVNVTRKNGSVKEYQLDNTLFLKKVGGQWVVWEMINSNPQDTVTGVRLTYVSQDQVIHTEMVDADSNLLTPPAVTAPEGKTFSGWYTQTVDANGGTTMELAFAPDEDGTVRLPAGTVLEPMTLYALYD